MQASTFNLTRLRAQVKPFRLHYFSRLRSTNDHAARLRRAKKLFAPSIVLGSHQLAGRGRGENRWWSSQKSLTLTFVLPISEHLQPQQIPLIAGLAVRNALEELTGVDSIQLKWPNDLLHADRKLAGLLCERVQNADLIGIGINVNHTAQALPARLRAQSTSLLQLTGAAMDMNAAVAALARHVHTRLSRHNDQHFGAVLREYDRYHALVGRRISVTPNTRNAEPSNGSQPLTGVCVGLDRIGRLLLRDRGATVHRIVAGHVSFAAHR
jgi:BirA family biotin operon repressor/biotin-[acetyl-CoA-carboxylase] ligase